MRILVCGDRFWQDKDAIEREILKHDLTGMVIIQGAAPGADTLAGEIAKEWAIDCLPFPAKWRLYHKAAGPIRNQQMLDEGKPDLVLAFHHDLSQSRGTKDMVARANRAGVAVQVFAS